MNQNFIYDTNIYMKSQIIQSIIIGKKQMNLNTAKKLLKNTFPKLHYINIINTDNEYIFTYSEPTLFKTIKIKKMWFNSSADKNFKDYITLLIGKS